VLGKYTKGIGIGIVGGIIIIVLMILQDVLLTIINLTVLPVTDLTTNSYLSDGTLICGLLMYIVYAIILLFVGALTIRSGGSDVHDIEGAITVSGSTGLVTGVIWWAAAVVIAVIMYFVSAYPNFMDVTDIAYSSLFFGGLNLVCCGPVYLVASIVIAMIGGVLYAVVISRKPLSS